MFEDVPDLPGGSAKPATAGSPRVQTTLEARLVDLPVDELLSLRAQIEARLPARDLRDMDLARELVIQVLALQAMQQKVLDDENTPANQKAQVANSLSAGLINLVKLQSDVYSSERFKQVEAILIDTLQKLPVEAQEEFLAAYELALSGVK